MCGEWITWDTLNSNLFNALVTSSIGALAGAGGGAWAAQRIADRAAQRKQLIQEIRDCNAGIDAAAMICSAFVNLKQQHVAGMKKIYDEQRSAVVSHAMGVQSGRIKCGALDIGGVDQQTLPLIKVRVDRLEAIVMEKLSVSGRPRGLMTMTSQSTENVNEVIQKRNDLIENIKHEPQEVRVQYIFGLPIDGKGIDETYRDCMEGLSLYTDDVIYYARELCLELMKHGKRTEDRFKKRFRGLHPKTVHADFGFVTARGLMPPDERYASWERSYATRVGPTGGRRWDRTRFLIKRTWRSLRGRPRKKLRL